MRLGVRLAIAAAFSMGSAPAITIAQNQYHPAIHPGDLTPETKAALTTALERGQQITPDFWIRVTQEQFQLRDDSLVMRRMRKTVEEGTMEIEPEKIEVKSDKVIKHLHAEGGVPLPLDAKLSMPEMFRDPKGYMERQAAKFAERRKTLEAEHFTKVHKKERPDPFLPGSIPTCTKSRTDELPAIKPAKEFGKLDEGLKIDSKKTYFDFLILPEHAPRELDRSLVSLPQAFGEQTKLKFFSHQRGDVISINAAKDGVECLPFRMRLVGKKRFVHYGTDALKNFDIKPKGDFHPAILRRLYDFLPP